MAGRFEMVCGHAPFMSGAHDKQQQFRDTCDYIGNFKEHIAELLGQHPRLSPECKHLITRYACWCACAHVCVRARMCKCVLLNVQVHVLLCHRARVSVRFSILMAASN